MMSISVLTPHFAGMTWVLCRHYEIALCNHDTMNTQAYMRIDRGSAAKVAIKLFYIILYTHTINRVIKFKLK